MTAVGETGIPVKMIQEIRYLMKKGEYGQAERLLHEGRSELLKEIHQREDEMRHIDWLIYSLNRQKPAV